MQSLTVSAALGAGWDIFKKRPWFFVGVTAIVFLVSALSSVLDPGEHARSIWAAVIGGLASLAISTFIDMGATAVMLKAHENTEAVSFSDLWHPELFWKYLFANVLVGILVVIGLILLIVPGVVLALMFYFVKLLVVDRGLAPIEALKESARITRGHKLDLLLLTASLVVLNVVGFLALVVGLFITVPVSALAVVQAYRTLAIPAPEPVAA